MSLQNIWDAPLVSPLKPAPTDSEASPLKRPHQSLFLSDSDSDYERPPKRATPAPTPARPSDVDALFEDLDRDEDEDLRYKPLAPALDLAKLTKEAEVRHARAGPGPSQTPGGSTAGGADGTGKDDGEDKSGVGEKKGRKVLPKLDEERLVGSEGFPQLIKDIRGFVPKGKGHEHSDLNRLLQVYQFWTHRMYPKTSFKDTVGRVEKLCHSKRMQVRLSVWRDEFNGTINGKKLDEDPDIIDLTEPTLVGAEDGGDDEESNNPLLKSDQASSRAPSLPPTSSEAGDDEFDIDAVIKAEEERLAALREGKSDSKPSHASLSPMLTGDVSIQDGPNTNRMNVDEASLWDAFDELPVLPEPLGSSTLSTTVVGEDEDMWNIVDEMEQTERNRSGKTQIPVSGVNAIPSLDSTSNGNTSRATNDDDWDEMYS